MGDDMKKNLTSALAIILTVCIVFANIYISITKSISPESIKTNINNNLLAGFIYDDNGNKTEIFKTILKLTNLDEETVVKLMENPTADEIITDVVNSIYDYNLTGDASYKYSKEKVISTVEDNIDKVMSEIEYNLTEQDRSDAIEYTKTHTDYIIDTIYATDIGDYTRD